MSLIETISKIDTAFGLFKEMQTNLSSEGCRIDKEISHHYHVLELITMNAPQISKVAKSLRMLLKNRRAVKESLAIIDSILSNHNTKVTQRTKRVNDYENEAKETFNRIMGVCENE